MGFISNFVIEEEFDDENEVNTYLKPEFRGRMDCIIPFNCLNKEMILSIIDKNIKELTNKLSFYNVEITMSQELKTSIVDNLLKDNLGARSIAKIFRENIKTLIANEIIANDIASKSKIHININKNTNEIYLEFYSKNDLEKEKNLFTCIFQLI
ncbi:MAG: hypothetical protein AB7D41_11120 [Arcobacter sp.]|uniref:hypothetical protein n=1 Tax=Arcobacter sp. TaxID=1872629 RepID=UPI003CFF1193